MGCLPASLRGQPGKRKQPAGPTRPPHGWAKDRGVVAPSVRPVHLPRSALAAGTYAEIGLHVIRVHMALPQLGPVPAVVVLVVASATEGARGAGLHADLLLQAEGCGRWSPNECL